mmetsp:Transcript_16370/g.14780  ORF Transcript_16370/g.14780 Transcript_16370/m.14780 type:complete len:109 (-) Transcript_16370:76-402(-)
MNQLKEAEKKATLLVQDARKSRVDRLKEAKVEAEQLISIYKAELEEKYQAALAKQTGSSGQAGNALAANTTTEINNLSRDFNARKEGVEKILLDAVLNVKIEAPKARA